MNKQNQHLKDMSKTKAAIALLYNEINLINDYEELQAHLNQFMKFYTQQANEKNNRVNKSLMGFINYFNKVAPKNKTAQSIEKHSKGKRLRKKATYKDYLPEIQILRARGLSFKAISDYCLNNLKIKVSKETIRTRLNELKECQD